MEESDRVHKQPNEQRGRVLTEEFIDGIDKITKSPSQRASDIWLALDKGHLGITNWDVVCFSIETLGLMSSEFPWLREAAMMVSKLVYKAHYLNHERIMASDHEISPKEQSASMNIPRMTK